MGYPEVVKGYRLWARNLKGFKMITSRNVTFNESDMPWISEKHQGDIRMGNKENVTRL